MQSRPIYEFVPYLSTTDAAKAVAFYSRMFSVDPYLLLNMPDGRVMHCEFRIGNARFFVVKDSRNMVARRAQHDLVAQLSRSICTFMIATRWEKP